MLVLIYPGSPSWFTLHPDVTAEHLGSVPSFLDLDDPRPAKEQFKESYIGGWNSRGHKWVLLPDKTIDTMDGDPPLQPYAECRLRDETIRLYECSYVVIIQPDGSFDASRMD